VQKRSWLDSVSDTIEEWSAIVATVEFWSIVAVGATFVGFLIAAGAMLTDFSIMRMTNCFNASNLNAYLLFNILLFFVFDGLLAIGEIFNYFESKRNGVPHKRSSLFWFMIITLGLGSAGLVMLKSACLPS
jgi:phosphate starvation-inducible membrane PsiE